MNEQLKALKKRIETATTERNALQAKGADITQEDVLNITAKNDEIASAVAAVKSFVTSQQMDADFKALLETEVNPIFHEDAEQTVKTAGQFIGSAKAGESEIDLKTKSVLWQDGECLISEKQFNAISEKSYFDAFRSYMRKGEKKLGATELKVLQEGVDADGGFLVPTEMLNRMIQKQPAPTRLAGLVETVSASRDSISMPKVNYSTDNIYTTGIRSTWTGEVPSSSTVHAATKPVFGQKKIDIYTNMMSLPLTNDLLEDSSFPLMGWVQGKFQETIDLLKDYTILSGTGVNQPHGILNNVDGTDEPVSANIGNPISADGIINLAWDLPEQYEANARYVFNKTSVGKYIATLKDGDDRYLWGQGLQDSGLAAYGPGTRMLAGTPVVFSAFMPSTGSANKVMLYGDLGGYLLVNRVGFSIRVLNELYAETNQVMMLGRLRFGGAVLEGWRIRVGVQS